MSWVKWGIAVFLIFMFFRFIQGKLKDPMNPAGYAMPGVTKALSFKTKVDTATA